MEMGIDRILFSVDYPFVDNPPATNALKPCPCAPRTRRILLSGNAKRLLKL
jgi:predicted TIM-barrel fold metal-dependent hydrolase